MARAIDRTILMAFALATALGGCSANPVIDLVPTAVGGLPTDTPTRPTAPHQYPAVHDMPPPRPDTPLSADDQVKMEKDLKAARDKQEDQVKAISDDKVPDKKAPAAAQKPKKKKPATKGDETTGTKTNP
jgi:hypothetical protein